MSAANEPHPLPEDEPFRIVEYRRGDFGGLCLAGYEGFDLSGIPWDQIKQGLDPDRQLAKTSRTRRVVRLLYAPPGELPRSFYVKRVLIRDWRKRIGSIFVRSKARHEWEAGFRLLGLGIQTPRPVVFAEVRRGPWLAANYLATEELTGAVPLREEIERLASPEKRALFERLARWLWAAHKCGFYHDDCSAQHVFVSESDAEGHRAFWFIDLDNCRFHKRAIPWHRRIKNLFQLLRSIPPRWATRTERLRFVRAYLAASGDLPRLRPVVERMTRLAVSKNANIHLLADRRQRRGSPVKKRK